MRDFTTFPGRLGDEVLPMYYAAADVCVVPSHYEPFGLVAIEAMVPAVPPLSPAMSADCNLPSFLKKPAYSRLPKMRPPLLKLSTGS
uniref:Glycosyltransferase n=1 Tax=Desertifilum tharense IPPAS B-1220 TaxID=1781255 RepID=A0ACD5GUM8_9CYAN